MGKKVFLFFAAVFWCIIACAAEENAFAKPGGSAKFPAARKQQKKSVFLSPAVIRVERAPAYLAGDFDFWLENGLLNNGVKTKTRKVLAGSPEKDGKFQEDRLLLQVTVTRFEILQIPYHVEETGVQGFRHVGNIGGYIRIIAEPEGNTVGSIPFEQQVLFGTSNSPENRNSTFEDYGKFMIKSVISGKIIPELLKIPGLKVP